MSDLVQGLVQKISVKDTSNGKKVYNVKVNCNDTQEDEWFGHGFNKPSFFEGDEISFEIEQNGDFTNIKAKSVVVEVEGDGGGEPEPEPQRGRGGNRGGSSRGSSRGNSRSSGRGGNSGGRSGGRGNSGGRSSGSSRGSSGSSRGSSRGGSRSGGASNAKGMSKEQYWENKEKTDKVKDERITRISCQNTAIDYVKAAIEAGAVKLPAKAGEKLDAFNALIDEEAERLFELYYGKPSPFGGDSGDDAGDDEGSHDYDDDDDIPE